MKVKEGWICCMLPISRAKLLEIVERAKENAMKVSFPSIVPGMPKSLDIQPGLTKEGSNGKPEPIAPKDWPTLVRPWLESMGDLTQDIRKQYEEAREWAAEHPRAAIFIVLVVAGVLVVVFANPSLVYEPVLNFIGFTSKGVSKNSIASAVHSWIGNVQAGTFFAGCQSAAMAATGYGAATLGAVTQTGVVLSISGTALASKWLGSKERRLLGPRL